MDTNHFTTFGANPFLFFIPNERQFIPQGAIKLVGIAVVISFFLP
jgi:hypothetical protein